MENEINIETSYKNDIRVIEIKQNSKTMSIWLNNAELNIFLHERSDGKKSLTVTYLGNDLIQSEIKIDKQTKNTVKRFKKTKEVSK